MSTATTNTWVPALRALTAGLGGRGANRQWRVQGLKGGARAYFLWRLLSAAPRPALIVAPSGKEAERLTGRPALLLRRGRRRRAVRAPHPLSAELGGDAVRGSVADRRRRRGARRGPLPPAPEQQPDRRHHAGVAAAARAAARRLRRTQYLYVVEGEEIDRDAVAARLDELGLSPRAAGRGPRRRQHPRRHHRRLPAGPSEAAAPAAVRRPDRGDARVRSGQPTLAGRQPGAAVAAGARVRPHGRPAPGGRARDRDARASSSSWRATSAC